MQLQCIRRCTLNCSNKWIINFTIKCIFFFNFSRSLRHFLKWNIRCTFKCNMECPLNFIFYWIIFYTLMHWQLHENVQFKCNLWSEALIVPFGASLYRSWCTFMCNSKCIIRSTLYCIIKHFSNVFIVVSFPFSCASTSVLKSSHLLPFFNWLDLAFICSLKSIFKSIFKCVPYTVSFAISITSFGWTI